MKSITIFLILFIIKSSISEVNIEDYSIEKFITWLKKEGLYQKIIFIKKIYGQDLSIISCEELIKKGYGNCKRLVKEYMPISSLKNKIIKSTNISPKRNEIKKSRINLNVLKNNKYLNSEHKWDKLFEILSTILPPEEAKSTGDRIIKRAEREIPNKMNTIKKQVNNNIIRIIN